MNQADYQIIRCSECGAKNRIPIGHGSGTAKCGKCHQPLKLDHKENDQTGTYKLRCTECGARNRVPASKINAGAKCGKCGKALHTEALSAPQPVMVTDGNFEEKIMKSPLPALLFAWAPW